MDAPNPGTVVLFLAGDPALAERQASRPPLYGGLARLVVPMALLPGGMGDRMAPGRERPTGPDAFPADQVMCAQQLLEAAKRLGRAVKIVDVNQPGEDRALVQRFVGLDDVLPIAVRSDGTRLEGAESFGPGALQDFLAHA